MGIVYPADLAPCNSLQSSSTIPIFVGRRLLLPLPLPLPLPLHHRTTVITDRRTASTPRAKYSTWNICRTKNQQKRQKSKAAWCRI